MGQEFGEGWAAYHGDSCEVLAGIPNGSLHYSIFSPPFSSLYVYSDSERDMGNTTDDSEFFTHFEFIVKEIYRAMMPGRLCSVHCMNLPSTKQHNGYIGIRDFRGEIIRLYESAGWIFHSEVVIWKDPVTAMQRTKAIGLLHKQLVKDSAMSRQGIPDYICTFRKPGDNSEPVAGRLEHWSGDDSFSQSGDRSIDIWQRYASPVWMDINQSNTINNFRKARDDDDERHICPLQLDVIARCLQLWSNPGDVVLSPFMGVGSEGVESVRMGRRFVGCELKTSYFEMAVENLTQAEREAKANKLF